MLGEPRLDLVMRERVVAEVVQPLEERERRFGALLVARGRSGFPVAGLTRVLELDVDDVRRLLRASRDDEALGELEGDDAGRKLHGETLSPILESLLEWAKVIGNAQEDRRRLAPRGSRPRHELLRLPGRGAAEPGHATEAECVEHGPFNTLQRLTKPDSWKVRDPHHLLEDQPSAPTRARRPGGTDFRAVVPTYVHVITNGSLGAVSDDTIKRQMIALDLSFRGFYGGVDTGFRFVLRGVTRTNNAAWFNMGCRARAPRTPRSAHSHAGGPERAEHLHDRRRRLPRLGLLPGHRVERQTTTWTESSSTSNPSPAARTERSTASASRPATRQGTG